MSLPGGSDSSGLALVQKVETAKLGSVHPSVQPVLASWTPSWALYTRLCSPSWPSELQLGLPSRTPSATWAQIGSPSRTPSAAWRFLGPFLVLLQPSESSSRLHESSIFMFLRSCLARLPFEFNLQALGRLWGSALSLLGASWAQLGAS